MVVLVASLACGLQVPHHPRTLAPTPGVGELSGPTGLTLMRSRQRVTTVNVFGTFEVTDRVINPTAGRHDWVLEPVSVDYDEFGLQGFVLETTGAIAGVESSSDPRFHVGDTIFLRAEVKADGRLVQQTYQILVEHRGEARDGFLRKVKRVTGSGRIMSPQLLWVTDWEVDPPKTELVPEEVPGVDWKTARSKVLGATWTAVMRRDGTL